ncbi:MAG: hypothetical protein M3O88_02540 [Actinomycetota bacterium]|nr:hypothetical protein [Actinomycetota bacterium]
MSEIAATRFGNPLPDGKTIGVWSLELLLSSTTCGSALDDILSRRWRKR